jgi:hypothetical protein
MLLMLISATVNAAEPVPFLQRQRIGVTVTSIKLPPTLRKDLVSGLRNRILVRIILTQGSQPIAQTTVGIEVKYDLWDETFSMQTTVADSSPQSRTYQQIDDMMAALSRLRLQGLFTPDAAWRGKPLGVSVELLFNPVAKEQMDELRRWVAENSGPTRTQAGRDVSLPAGEPASDSRAWFNRIFSQYSAGALDAAAWRDRGSSVPFKLEDMSESPDP